MSANQNFKNVVGGALLSGGLALAAVIAVTSAQPALAQPAPADDPASSTQPAPPPTPPGNGSGWTDAGNPNDAFWILTPPLTTPDV